jgi:hypothetical protein
VFRDGKKKQVVIAKHDDGPIAQLLDIAEHAQRIRAAVDEIADEPDPVDVRLKGDAVEQAAEGVEAPLNVADRVGSHTSE